MIQVACGTAVSYAITEQGDCLSWGMGTNGQLGTGEEVNIEIEILQYSYISLLIRREELDNDKVSHQESMEDEGDADSLWLWQASDAEGSGWMSPVPHQHQRQCQVIQLRWSWMLQQ